MKRSLTAALVTLLALSACDAGVAPPAVEAISPERAAALYRDSCAICHGASGDGRGPRRRSLHTKPPDFRQASWRRDASQSGVRSVIRDGLPGTDMPAWKTLDASEVAGLAEYVLDLAAQGGGASGHD
jgi:mono/diheme cytochrome c family protein